MSRYHLGALTLRLLVITVAIVGLLFMASTAPHLGLEVFRHLGGVTGFIALVFGFLVFLLPVFLCHKVWKESTQLASKLTDQPVMPFELRNASVHLFVAVGLFLLVIATPDLIINLTFFASLLGERQAYFGTYGEYHPKIQYVDIARIVGLSIQFCVGVALAVKPHVVVRWIQRMPESPET